MIAIDAMRFEPMLREAMRPGRATRIADRNGATIAVLGDWSPSPGAAPAPGLHEARAPDGRISVVATRRSALSGWTVSVAAPKDQIDAALWRTVQGLAAAGLIAEIDTEAGCDGEGHLLEAYHRAFRSEDEIEAAYRIVLPDGSVRHLAGRGKVVARKRDGTPARIANVMVDVTEQALATQHIAEQAQRIEAEKARYQALVKVSSQLEWTANADGLTMEDSPTWRAFTGQTYEQWIGRGWLDAVHPDDRADNRERTAAAWTSAVEGRGEYQVDYRLRYDDGSWREDRYGD